MFCNFIDIGALSYYENDVHIVNMPNRNSIYHVLWYHIKHWHTLKEVQVILDRLPEYFFKTSNLYVSINKKCHKHVTNVPKEIGLAQDTFEER